MAGYDDMKLAVEALTGGRNTVLYDDMGLPSIMVIVPKTLTGEIAEGGAAEVHPAFKVGNKEVDCVYVSKYINIVQNERAYSLPFRDPAVNINFDEAMTACRKKGTGWGVTPNAVWAAIALWSKKNGTLPHGNNGNTWQVTNLDDRKEARDYTNTWETGVLCYSADKSGRTYTGSGPATWNHDHTPEGICDINGNVWEWVAGLQCRSGEICLIPSSDTFLTTTDLSDTSAAYKAVLQDNSLVASGTEDTIKLQNNQFVTNITERHTGKYVGLFKDTSAASGVTIPQILKDLAIYPADDVRTNYDAWAGGKWLNNSLNFTSTALRGGCWNDGANAGAFALNFHDSRSILYWHVGFRSAFVKL